MKKVLITLLLLNSCLFVFAQGYKIRDTIPYKDNYIIIIDIEDLSNYKYKIYPDFSKVEPEVFNKLVKKKSNEDPLKTIKDNDIEKELRKFKKHIIDSLEKVCNSKIKEADFSKVFNKYYAKSSLNINIKSALPLMTDIGWKTKVGNITSLEVLYEYQFSSSGMLNGQRTESIIPFAIEVGLSFSYAKKEASLHNQYFSLSNQTDIYGYNYDAHYTVHNATENFKYLSLDIPVYFKCGKPNLKKVSGWFKLGVINSLNIYSITNSISRTTIEGYYPQWDIVIFDVPELDYYTHREVDRKFTGIEENNLKKYTLWGALAVGLKVPLNNYKSDKASNFLLNMGLNFKYSLTPISHSSNNPSSNYFNINTTNFMHNKNRIFAPGAELGIVYVFKSINTK